MKKQNTKNGYYSIVYKIKDGAIPPDNINKFAYTSEDYEAVQVWHEYTDAEKAEIEYLEEYTPIKDNLPTIVDTLENGIAELGDIIGDIVYSQKTKKSTSTKGGKNGKK